MNANQTTAIFVLLAAASAFGAYSMRPVEVDPPAYEDTGEPLFPEFKLASNWTFWE